MGDSHRGSLRHNFGHLFMEPFLEQAMKNHAAHDLPTIFREGENVPAARWWRRYAAEHSYLS